MPAFLFPLAPFATGRPLVCDCAPSSGIFDVVQYDPYTFPMSPGDGICFTARTVWSKEMIRMARKFGMAKLIGVRPEVGCSRPGCLLRPVFARVREYATAGQQDNMTVVVLKAFQQS